jgi:hypothetical protein
VERVLRMNYEALFYRSPCARITIAIRDISLYIKQISIFPGCYLSTCSRCYNNPEETGRHVRDGWDFMGDTFKIELSADEIRDFSKEKIAKYKELRVVEFRKELPKTQGVKLFLTDL